MKLYQLMKLTYRIEQFISFILKLQYPEDLC
jgi:hypothetical protein